MEENENKQEPSLNTEELKNATVDTVKQVKESMKNVNVKEEAEATKGFVMEMFKNPLEKIKEIANDSENKYFKTSIILLIVWVAATLISVIDLGIFDYFTWTYFRTLLLAYIKAVFAPILMIVAMSVILFLMNKKSKKSLTTLISTLTATRIPIIFANVIGLLTIISSNIVKITSKISSLASLISTVLMYFAIRELYGEEDEKQAFKNFVIIEAIYLLVSLVISYLGIYI
ncbi:MAG: hypothetical protein IJE68_05910 [Clostridia bacterium]|nr:hypothetical protein [Clostridia bacterium]